MMRQRASDFLKEHRDFRWISSAGFALLAVALQMRFFDRSAVPMDEGQLVVVAARILDGEVLYRDVYTGIGPGIYHFTAGFFSLFGRDLLVTRWAQVGINAVITVCLWLLAARTVRLHWALLPPISFLFLILVSFPVLTMLNYSSLALAGALASLLVLQLYLDSGRIALGVGLGLLLAVTSLTKQNYGLLAIIAVGTAILWTRPRSALAVRSLGAAALPVAGAGAAVALITVAYFAIHGALSDLIAATVIDIGGPQLDAFDNPIPSVFGAMPSSDPRFTFLYTPPAMFNHMLHGGKILGQPITLAVREMATRLSYGIPIVVLAATPFVLWATRHSGGAAQRREAHTIALFSTLFFLGIFPSAIWSHLAFVVPPSLLVTALLCDRLEGLVRIRIPNFRWAALAASGAVVVICVTASLRIGETIRSWFPTPLDLPRATVFVTPNTAALYRGATNFVESCAAPDDPIFVAPDIPIVYFLTARRNPTPYELTIPGNVDGRVIIERLEQSQTRCIVYNPRMYPEFPPFAELFPLLNLYLESGYSPTTVIAGVDSEWHGLVRRDVLEP